CKQRGKAKRQRRSEHQLEANQIDKYARGGMIDNIESMVCRRRQAPHSVGQHVRNCLYRPVKVCLAVGFSAEERPESGGEGGREIAETTNQLILYNLYFVVPE